MNSQKNDISRDGSGVEIIQKSLLAFLPQSSQDITTDKRSEQKYIYMKSNHKVFMSNSKALFNGKTAKFS
jgi:hypothetical protein